MITVIDEQALHRVGNDVMSEISRKPVCYKVFGENEAEDLRGLNIWLKNIMGCLNLAASRCTLNLESIITS